ncbi:MAG TPA: hypothetical protein VMF90_14070 [Rhizobiaceae bacterium]|nr:hypothetical protein [Rhizobiaceae bacterium]
MKTAELRTLATRGTNSAVDKGHTEPRKKLTKKDYLFWGFVGLLFMSAFGNILRALEDPEVRQARLVEEARREQLRIVEQRKASAEAAKQAKEDAKAARLDACSRAEIQAFAVSQDAVRARLKAPSTASFPWTPIRAEHTGNCKFHVLAYVDAQNGFGAMVRSNYVATLNYEPETKGWRVTSVVLEN